MSPTKSRKTTKPNTKTRKAECSCSRSKLNAVSASAKKPKKESAGKKIAKTRARNKKRLEIVDNLRAKADYAYRENAPRTLSWHPDIVITEEDLILDPFREKYKLSVNVPNEAVIKKLSDKEFSEYLAGMREVIHQVKNPDEYHCYDILMPNNKTAKVRRV